MKKISLILILIILLCVFVGCSFGGKDFFALGTVINLKISGANSKKAHKQIEELISEVEKQVSVAIEDSDISKINKAKAGESVILREHTAFIYEQALELYDVTEGDFNPFIFPLVKLWKLDAGNFSIAPKERPSEQDINEVKLLCDSSAFSYNSEKKVLTKNKENAMLDFGGIAKGYVADKAKEICDSNKIKKALLNFGGNIYLIGNDYKVGVTHPRPENSNIYGVLKLGNVSVVTSGDYERYYLDYNTGERYCHIIDYKTGCPVNQNLPNSVYSATIIGENSLVCDAIATAVVVRGVDGIQEFFEKLKAKGYDLKGVIVSGQSEPLIIGEVEFKR